MSNIIPLPTHGFPDSSAGEESVCNAGVPGLGRSPGEGEDYPLQYSGLENSMNYTVQWVAKSQIQLSNFLFFHFHYSTSLGLFSNLVMNTLYDFS